MEVLGSEDCEVAVVLDVAKSFVPAAISAPSSGWDTRGVVEDGSIM